MPAGEPKGKYGINDDGLRVCVLLLLFADITNNGSLLSNVLLFASLVLQRCQTQNKSNFCSIRATAIGKGMMPSKIETESYEIAFTGLQKKQYAESR